MGTPLTNKYAEGYPGRRYYGGCEVVDEVERLAIERAKRIFGAAHANVQPHSGAQANLAAYMALIAPGDLLMGMSLPHGGHLTHGASVNHSGIIFRAVQYGVDPATGLIDYDAVRDPGTPRTGRSSSSPAAARMRGSSTSRPSGASPTRSAPTSWWTCRTSRGWWPAGSIRRRCPTRTSTTTTTHKTLRGPRGGMILCGEAFAKQVDKSVFPGHQGGPLMHVIAAKAVAFGEVLEPEFRDLRAQGGGEREGARRRRCRTADSPSSRAAPTPT